MNRNFVGVALLLLVCSALAEVVSEQALSDSGFVGLSVSGPNQKNCADLQLNLDLNQAQPGHFAVLSLEARFLPVESRDANVSVFWNDSNQTMTANATEFKNGWKRFVIDHNKLNAVNSVQLCAESSDSTTSIEVLGSSVFGFYKMPAFDRDDFVKSLVSNAPVVGDEFLITVTLHNSGSEAVDVNVFYKKPFVAFDAIGFVRGEHQFVGSIGPDQAISFSYTAKSIKSGAVTIPAAIVSYTNIFGEPETLVSNYPVITVGEAVQPLSAIVLNKNLQKHILPGDPIPIQVVVSNDSIRDLFDIGLTLDDSNSQLRFVPAPAASISVLHGGESQIFDFNVTANQRGEFSIGCRVSYQDLNIHSLDCVSTRILVENESFPTELVAAVVLALAALLVYLFYHFRKVGGE